MERIAALLTCHNRKEKTRKCLCSLYEITRDIDVFLVDDNSSDGTSTMVREEFPSVFLIHGSGSLFWNRGMHRAWVEALRGKYDYYLWLNDDIELYPFFLTELLCCERQSGGDSIIVGIIEDEMHRVIYGGTDKHKKLIQPNGAMNPITDMNGNVVLVPQTAVDKIGIIDPKYNHAFGDTDYGYMANRAGIKLLTTTKSIAKGYPNVVSRIRKWNTNIIGRFRFLSTPFAMSPSLGFYFFRKHFGVVKAFAYWTYIVVINISPDFLAKKIMGIK